MSVAIAVPSLDQRRFLPDALDSLRVSDVTVHRAVLDAGSRDGSCDVISGRTRELSFWRSEPDAGQAAAVNEGIDTLCRRHPDVVAVGWLNADDVFLPGGIDCLWRALRDHPDWVIAQGRGAALTEEGGIAGEIGTEPFNAHRFSRGCTIVQPATLVRRSAWEQVGGLDPSLEMCFDYDLWWRLSRLGTIGRVNTLVAASRDHGQTKTRRRRAQYFREATAIVRREIHHLPWHWYISAAMERQVDYAIGRRPSFGKRLRACAEAGVGYLLRRPVVV
jgi:GT2 family glycosyltransferase